MSAAQGDNESIVSDITLVALFSDIHLCTYKSLMSLERFLDLNQHTITVIDRGHIQLVLDVLRMQHTAKSGSVKPRGSRPTDFLTLSFVVITCVTRTIQARWNAQRISSRQGEFRAWQSTSL